MTVQSRNVLLAIARCPVVEQCLNGDTAHPCSAIVRSQGVSALADFQSPEPWSGEIRHAPILFVSSNPSIEPTAPNEYPRPSWDDGDIVDYFDHRFGGSPLSSISDGIYGQLPGRERAGKLVRFWVAMRARAAELHEKRPAELSFGKDYALTEVVHCKSWNEIGVEQAVGPCTERYLIPVLSVSTASVVVGIGAFAERSLRSYLDLPQDQGRLIGPIEIAGQERYITFLPHPAGYGKAKKFGNTLTPEEMQRLVAWLRRPEATSPGAPIR